MAKPMKGSWEARFNQALAMRHAGRFSDAIEVFERLLHAPLTRKREAAARGELGGIHLFDLKDAPTAEAHFRRCVALAPRAEAAS